jgi:hypothetical protein
MSNRLIHPASTLDAEYVALNLQADDRREVEGLGYTNVSRALVLSVLSSDPAVTFWNQNHMISGIAGVSRTDAHSGAIWMMTTPDIRACPKLFVKEARKWVDQLTSFDVLYNVADPRNTLHMKLLHLLGFKKLGYKVVGPNRLTYVEFAKLTQCASHP